jgi:hypothetical protein
VHPAFVAYSKDENYINFQGLQGLARTEFREDVVIGNLAKHILQGTHNSEHITAEIHIFRLLECSQKSRICSGQKAAPGIELL